MAELYYGRGKDEDNARLIEFINAVFFDDDPENRAFLEILPKIYKDEYRPAYNNFVVQSPDGEYRAAVGNFYCDMTAGGTKLKACCIGNVAVGMNYRRMGYMKELMDLSVRDMKENGTDLAYLGGQRQRYGYFGFEHAGISYEFGFSRSALRHTLRGLQSGFEALPLTPGDTDSLRVISELYRLNPVTAARPLSALDDILRSWRQIPYVLKENGKTVGYLVFGGDHRAVVEFGVRADNGIARAVAAAFETADKYAPGHGLRFYCAPFETEKIGFFSENCDGIDIGGCEMILVLDFCRVIGAYLAAETKYTRLADGEMTVLIHGVNGDENVTVTVKDNVAKAELTDKTPDAEMSHREATRAFFSLHPNERRLFPAAAQTWLPLPMYQSPCDTM